VLRLIELDAKRRRRDDAVVGRVLLCLFGGLALAVWFPPLGAEVVRSIDVALVEEDRDLGAFLWHGEEAVVFHAAARSAERPGPSAEGLEHAGHADPNAPGTVRVFAVGDVADVHAQQARVVGADVVVEAAHREASGSP